MHQYTYLALGDSYTIGESLTLTASFPYQLVQALRGKDQNFTAPEIIARTGWTTADLESAVNGYRFLHKYDFVTLLIGVNNQYQRGEATVYKAQFEMLLKKAIELANGKQQHVIVVSIPDYGATPFGQSGNPEKIGHEIDIFNSINKALSIQYKVQYVDITPLSKEAKQHPELVAEDSLHPSEAAYAQWTVLLAEAVAGVLK